MSKSGNGFVIETSTARKAIEGIKEKALEYLKRMVETNSFTYNAEGVDKVGDIVVEMFEPMGFEVERPAAIDCTPYKRPPLGRHVIMVRKGRTNKRIALCGHLDTVFTEQEERDNDFHWRIEGDRIYGPGTIDMKGGNVVMWMTLRTIANLAPNLFDEVTWVIMLNAAEEGLSSDFGMLERKYLGQDGLANLIFESGREEDGKHLIKAARKGRARISIKATGRAAHAGAHHPKGANAIVQLSHFISEVSQLTDYDKDLTANVGFVSGGVVPNRVPDRAEALMEMRAFEPAVLRQALDKVLAWDGRSTVASTHDGYQARLDVKCVQLIECWPPNPKTEKLMEIFQQTGAELGLHVAPRMGGGLSDGNFTWDIVPTIDGLGPCGDNGHCATRSDDGSVDQEYFLPASLVPRALLACEVIQRLVKNQ